MRFDWYSATLTDDPDTVLRSITAAADLADCVQARAKNGFRFAAEIRRGDQCLATVFWGGSNVGGMVQVQGSGKHAEFVSRFLRDRFPDHRLTRADVAADYDDPSAWAFWSGYANRVSKNAGVKFQLLQNGVDGSGGRTIYLGSRKSVVQVRIYEKGKKDGGSPNWVRVELVVRPKRREARRRLSAAPYRDFYGCSRWTQHLAETMGMEDVPRHRAGSVYALSDIEKKRLSLARQYGNTLEAWLTELGGDPQELGCQLWLLVANERQRRQALHVQPTSQ